MHPVPAFLRPHSINSFAVIKSWPGTGKSKSLGGNEYRPPLAGDASYQSGRCAEWIKVKNPAAPAATRSMELSGGLTRDRVASRRRPLLRLHIDPHAEGASDFLSPFEVFQHQFARTRSFCFHVQREIDGRIHPIKRRNIARLRGLLLKDLAVVMIEHPPIPGPDAA